MSVSATTDMPNDDALDALEHAAHAPAYERIEKLRAFISEARKKNFNMSHQPWRWQARTIDDFAPYIVAREVFCPLFQIGVPTSVGKTLVAIYLAEGSSTKLGYHGFPEKRRVIYAVPQRNLVQSTLVAYRSFFEKGERLTWLKGVSGVMRSSEIRGDVCVTTFEHGFMALVNGLRCHKGPQRDFFPYMSTGLLIVDEIHEMYGTRGTVVMLLLALARHLHIPVLIMSATLDGYTEEKIHTLFHDQVLMRGANARKKDTEIPVTADFLVRSHIACLHCQARKTTIVTSSTTQTTTVCGQESCRCSVDIARSSTERASRLTRHHNTYHHRKTMNRLTR
jgi:hypothetical protein